MFVSVGGVSKSLSGGGVSQNHIQYVEGGGGGVSKSHPGGGGGCLKITFGGEGGGVSKSNSPPSLVLSHPKI